MIVELDEPSLPAAASPAGFEARSQVMSSVSSRLAAALPRGSVSQVQSLGSQPMVAMTVDAEGLAVLRSEPGVVSVTRNNTNKISTTYTTNINHVGAPTAWAKGDTGAGQAIAIIDTGVDKTNAYLSGKVVAEGCFTSALADRTSSTTTPICPGLDDDIDCNRQRPALPSDQWRVRTRYPCGRHRGRRDGRGWTDGGCSARGHDHLGRRVLADQHEQHLLRCRILDPVRRGL